MNKPPIRVKEIWPAVPADWPHLVAWREGTEESGIVGYGKTLQEAIDDLKSMEEDK